ncbi:AdoMet-homocysteine methyltransferase [Scheffersomyces coipomensis]|uniref:AdoMet-homocysteine methyltransferase n=1 Tax=Scheffersomyces coipomensis TaxID=1788519 RepID=UPI00315DF515
MVDVKEILKSKRLVLDGALGTELERLIPKDDENQPRRNSLWSGYVLLKQPELVEQVHQSYLQESQVDLLITSTYQTSYMSLKIFAKLSDEEIIQLWDKSITVIESAIEKSGIEKPIYIIGSIGPYASYLCDGSEYTGDYKQVQPKELIKYHQPLYEYFINHSKVDIIGFETIPNFVELESIFELIIINPNPKKLFYISFNFNNDNELVDGSLIETVILYIIHQLKLNQSLLTNFLGIGLNCIDYRKITSIITKINSIISLHGDQINDLNLIIYPNLGFEYSDETDDYRVNKQETHWIKSIKEWLQFSNVRIIGGCCSTDPYDIQQIRELVDMNHT